MISFPEIALVVASYFLGCFNTAYYLTRSRLEQDIRSLGSSNAGAKNAGRVLGKTGFLITFLGDFLKGVLPLLIAKHFGFNEAVLVICMLAVVAGHILPIQLSFRGGKGLATTLAALLILDYQLAIILLTMTGLFTYLSKNDHISVALVIVLAPFIALLKGQSSSVILGLVVLSLLILYSHRFDLRKTLRTKFA